MHLLWDSRPSMHPENGPKFHAQKGPILCTRKGGLLQTGLAVYWCFWTWGSFSFCFLAWKWLYKGRGRMQRGVPLNGFGQRKRDRCRGVSDLHRINSPRMHRNLHHGRFDLRVCFFHRMLVICFHYIINPIWSVVLIVSEPVHFIFNLCMMVEDGISVPSKSGSA